MTEQIDLREIMQKAGGFAPDAYRFLRDGLAHTVGMVHGEEAAIELPDDDDESRHVSGQQLCLGLRDYAIDRYGPLSKAVLNRWGVTCTEDFGRIVFALIDAKLMRKTDDDTLEDFRDVYDFDEAFRLVRLAPIAAGE
ncbi:MAG: Minf_1886 family protein [Planctomycetota bacterium]